MGVLGSVMLGLGASMMGRKQQSAAAEAAGAHAAMAAAKPAVPEAPAAPEGTGDPSVTDNAAMEAARERERLDAARRRLAAQEIFTSGLGAGGLAGTSKKTLLGG